MLRTNLYQYIGPKPPRRKRQRHRKATILHAGKRKITEKRDRQYEAENYFATGNKNKMREIHEILGDLGWEILSMKEAGIDVDIVEDGTTFEENALIKAKAVAAHCNDIVLADDSGLEIDYLNKEPGIYSARYAGEDTSYDIQKPDAVGSFAGRAEGKTYRAVCMCHCSCCTGA